MQTATVTYPARPQHADERIIKPSAAFKKEVSKVLGSILFFIVTYIVLVLAGVLLAVLCGYGGVMLVTVFPRLITFIFGAGLICLGVMVLYFLVKFLFKKNAADRSHLTELKPADQPELFNFVRTLTNETQSPFPKRIYISPEVKHLLSLNIPTETLQTPAWVVFTNAEALQRQQTEKLYTNAGFKQTPETLTLNLFTQRYETEVKKYTLNPAYKNFYNFRKMTTVNIDTLDYDRLLDNVDTFEKILDEATLELPLLADGLRSDIHTLELIQEARNGIHTFEFEGKKMNRDEAASLRDQLKNELSVAEAKMVATDRNMVALFFHQAEKKGQLDKIKTDYKTFFASAEAAEENLKKFEEIRKAVYPLYAESLTLEKVHAVVNLMKRLESPIKESIKDLLADPSKQTLYTPAEKSTLEEYVSKQQAYFANDTFLDGELKLFNESIMLFQGIGADYSFALKKELLDWQLQLLD